MKQFVKSHFNKLAFKDVKFSEFKAEYAGRLGGFDITEVAKELGIDTPKRSHLRLSLEVKKKKNKMFKDTSLFKYATDLIALKNQEDKIFKLVLDNRFIKELITHLNTDEQLGKDKVDSLGAHLGTYSHATEVISKGQKKAGAFINLNDTGAFWDSWKVQVKKALIEIDANPFKEDTNLFDEYGIDVLGLTDTNLQILINEATKLYIQYYRKNLPIN